MRMRLAIFASGNGSNAQAIAQAIDEGRVKADLVALVCDQKGAGVLDRLKDYPLAVFNAGPKDYPNRQAWELAIVDFLQDQGVNFIALAGFMRIVGQPLLAAYEGRMINIHPSLLPAFPGRDGIGDAFRAGVSQTGVSIHFVDAGIDSGELIAQVPVRVEPHWEEADLAQAIHQVEHQLYPQVLARISEELSKGE